MLHFTRQHRTLHLLTLLAMASLLLTACSEGLDFVNVEDPATMTDIRNTNECQLYVVGQVIDARTLDPIPQATIQLFDQAIASDQAGMYRLKIDKTIDPQGLEYLMSARAGGYLMDTYQFTPDDWLLDGECEGTVSYVCVDFVMSPKNDPFLVLPNVDNVWSVQDTALAITERDGEGRRVDTTITTLEIVIPAGAVNEPTEICVSTYERPSYLAALPGNALYELPLVRFRISADPLVVLNQPFTISFNSDHPVPVDPADPLGLYRFDDLPNPFSNFSLASNTWLVPNDATVSYEPTKQVVQVSSTQLGSYMAVNQAYPVKFKESFALGDINSGGAPANCFCGDPTFFKYEVQLDGRFTYQLDGAASMPLKDQLVYLNDLKVLTNTPFSSLTTLSNGPQPDQYNQFYPDPLKKLIDHSLIDKCEVLFITGTNIDHRAQGTQYMKGYNLDRVIGVQIDFTPFKCPTTTPCHQGCP